MERQNTISKKPDENSTHRISYFGGVAIATLIILINFLNTKSTGWINWTLIFGGVIAIFLIARLIPLNTSDMGLERKYLKSGAIHGGVSLLLVLLTFSLVFIIKSDFFIDSRYAVTFLDLLYLIFIFIPLHTIIIEELLFRGALLGYLLKITNKRLAVFISSALFGLWHILPSLGLAKSSSTLSSTLGTDYIAQILSVIGAVLLTFVAALVFCWIRIRSKSLLAPILAHWAINVTALVFAYLAN